MKSVVVALLLLATAGADLRAAEAGQARNCTRIADNTARLLCYDAAFAASAVTITSTAAVPVSVSPAPEFGDRGQLHGEPQARESLPKRVDFRILKADTLAGGLFRLTMKNGQVWVTKQADWALNFEKGEVVTIQRMALGGYRVSHAGQGRDVAVTRVF